MQSPCASTELRATPFALQSSGGPPPEARRAKGGGAGGIRTLDRALQPYNGLANRRLQPLGHSSMRRICPTRGRAASDRFQAAQFRVIKRPERRIRQIPIAKPARLKMPWTCYGRVITVAWTRQRHLSGFFAYDDLVCRCRRAWCSGAVDRAATRNTLCDRVRFPFIARRITIRPLAQRSPKHFEPAN